MNRAQEPAAAMTAITTITRRLSRLSSHAETSGDLEAQGSSAGVGVGGGGGCDGGHGSSSSSNSR